jgi:quercetin dioxygenase-like cupin family protein
LGDAPLTARGTILANATHANEEPPMLTRRAITGCALCAITGFVAESVAAEKAPDAGGIKRTILMQTDGPVPGYVTVMVAADIAAHAVVARHTHPGIESAYVLEGGGILSVDGEAEKKLGPGEAFQVPATRPHAFTNGDKATKLSLTLVVEKGKPLATSV